MVQALLFKLARDLFQREPALEWRYTLDQWRVHETPGRIINLTYFATLIDLSGSHSYGHPGDHLTGSLPVGCDSLLVACSSYQLEFRGTRILQERGRIIIAFVRTSWDVAVIGAGVFGSWTAYRLAESGKKVLLVDGYGVANPLSSSGAESRIMRTAYGANEAYTRFAHQSLPDWMELFRSTGADPDRLFLKTGVLWLGKKGGELLAASQESMRRVGVNFEVLDGDDIRSRYPQIDPGGEVVAILEPDAGVLVAEQCVRVVVEGARRHGSHSCRKACAFRPPIPPASRLWRALPSLPKRTSSPAGRGSRRFFRSCSTI